MIKKKELREHGKASKLFTYLEDIEKTYRKSKLNKGEGYIRKVGRRGGRGERSGKEVLTKKVGRKIGRAKGNNVRHVVNQI